MSAQSQLIPTNTFATQSGNILLSLLDTNFNQLAAFLNNPLNYANYLVDSGSANAYVVTFPTGAAPSAYTAGLAVQMKVANANTGSSTLNVNGLGTKNITNTDLTALASGQLQANSVVYLVYDGTQFQLSGITVSGGLFSGQARPYYTNSGTVSTTSTYNFNAATTGQIALLTVTNAITVTFGTPSNIIEGAMYKFILKAGDTSARTYAWSSSFKFPSAVAQLTSGTITSGAYDVITFIGGASQTLIYDGSSADLR